MTKRAALEVLESYFKAYGIEDVTLLDVNDRSIYWEVQCLKLYGLFLIDKNTGEIDDNYGTFDEMGEKK